jgi:hypothetical protein
VAEIIGSCLAECEEVLAGLSSRYVDRPR